MVAPPTTPLPASAMTPTTTASVFILRAAHRPGKIQVTHRTKSSGAKPRLEPHDRFFQDWQQDFGHPCLSTSSGGIIGRKQCAHPGLFLLQAAPSPSPPPSPLRTSAAASLSRPVIDVTLELPLRSIISSPSLVFPRAALLRNVGCTQCQPHPPAPELSSKADRHASTAETRPLTLTDWICPRRSSLRLDVPRGERGPICHRGCCDTSPRGVAGAAGLNIGIDSQKTARWGHDIIALGGHEEYK